VELHQVSEDWQRDSISIVQVLKLRSSSILDPTIELVYQEAFVSLGLSLSQVNFSIAEKGNQ
jgi:hypothetical protein